ncbi:linear amide C-N hydrolase [Methylocystis iwaonis]|uniref:Choloylglycine hydrolase n=1 Tax=Methylocystis iwaonis TaxID=2885079 RepID=A0ABM8EAD8_9HYPH|nr:linear amide C-N hydrolase [Methylocystis iwaonis]BDV34958.1 choloylglycine hydrolase [Methylocystis iwaonis]
MPSRATVVAAVLATSLLTSSAFACSRILWNTDQANVVARTMDLYMSDKARIAVFPRGASHGGPAGMPNMLSWKSKYASVGATALDIAVSDGLNEKGLSANLLYLHDTKYEKRDSRAGLTNAAWAQYILDNFASVEEAVEAMKQLQIVSLVAEGREWPLHLSIADAKGDSAIFEFVNGKLTINRGPETLVMTNEPAFSIQRKNLLRYKLFGGKLPMPGGIDPKSRFVRASSYLKTLPKPASLREAVAGAYSVIRNVAVPFGAHDTSGGDSSDTWPTLWASLADLSNKVYFFQSTKSANLFWVDLSKLNVADGAPVLDVDAYDVNLSGEISDKLKPSQLKM